VIVQRVFHNLVVVSVSGEYLILVVDTYAKDDFVWTKRIDELSFVVEH
jgi:hypothetical protein